MLTQPSNQPVTILREGPATYETITTNFDRFNEYGLILSSTEDGLREGIKNFPSAGYGFSIGPPYRLGSLFYATCSKSRSCD